MQLGTGDFDEDGGGGLTIGNGIPTFCSLSSSTAATLLLGPPGAPMSGPPKGTEPQSSYFSFLKETIKNNYKY